MYRLITAAATAAALALGGCATRATQSDVSPSAVAPTASGSAMSNCIRTDSIHDWKVLDNRTLIVWAPNRNRPYRVELHASCSGIRSSHAIGFGNRTGRLCSMDSIVTYRPYEQRCMIRAIYPLDASSLNLERYGEPGIEPEIVEEYPDLDGSEAAAGEEETGI